MFLSQRILLSTAPTVSEPAPYCLFAYKKPGSDTTYCIAVFKMGTPYCEFIVGETDNNVEYQVGMTTRYVYRDDYTNILGVAVDWLKALK